MYENSEYSAIPERLRTIISQLWHEHVRPDLPLAYQITFSCYGARLHGHALGSVDRSHNIHGSPYLSPCRRRVEAISSRLLENRRLLQADERTRVLEAMREVCLFRGWIALAIQVRSNHVHAVVHGRAAPEKMMNDFKSYATRTLNRRSRSKRRRNWAEHGSTKYLWEPDDVEASVQYVLYMQGKPMAVFYPE